MNVLNPSKFVTHSLIGAIGLSAIAFLSLAEEAQAQMCTSSGSSLPPIDCAYAAEQHLRFPNGIDFSNPFHSHFRDIELIGDDPMNIGDMQIERFNSDVDMVVTLANGEKIDLKDIPAQVETKITLIDIEVLDNGLVKKTFENEMLGLNLDSLPGEFMFRENPDLPSTGITMVTELSDGTFGIMSFFDINAQISNDGGMTWLNSLEPGRVNAVNVPEPLTIFGSATALGFGTFFKRKLGKKRQQNNA